MNLREILVEDRRIIYILAAAAIAALWWFGIPRWAKVFGAVFVIGAIISYPYAARLVRWLHTPDYRYLVDIKTQTNGFAMYELPPEAWENLEVEEHELFPLDAVVPAWTCKEYDPDENTAKGTWRGAATDLELIKQRENIDEQRSILERLAKWGLSIRMKQSGIQTDSLQGILNEFVSAHERESIFEGEKIEESIEKAIDKWDLDDQTQPDKPDHPESEEESFQDDQPDHPDDPTPSTNGEAPQ